MRAATWILTSVLAASLTQLASSCHNVSGKAGGTDADADSDGDSDGDSDVGEIWGYALIDGTFFPAEGSIEVIVSDSDDNDWISSANSTGYYEITGLPPDSYSLEAHTNDFEFWGSAGPIDLAAGESIQVDIALWEQNVDAPYVYLYPETAQEVSVSLELAEGLQILASEPEYGDGWNVWAEPSGLLDGKYDFLFYEATVMWGFQDEVGWAVPAEGVFDWFEEQLPALGLSDQETVDFLDYWTINLPFAPCYHVFPQPLSAIEETAVLVIDPMPDSQLRLWLLIGGADSCGTFAAPAIVPFAREGFTVVEWGVVLDTGTF